MTSIRLKGDLSDLIGDLREIPREAKVKMRETVRDGIKAGNMLARDFARESAGAHGKRYPNSMSTELAPNRGLFGNLYAGEYGPVSDRAQGGMSFEFGSRNQKPHLDLARSADIIGPSFAQEVRHMLDDLFWPGAK